MSQPDVTTASSELQRPNIVVIVADDLGYADLGIQGQAEIPTPNIDSIGKEGVRFTSGYVSAPVCSPTRAGLLTGRYQSRFGHEMNPGGGKKGVTFGLSLEQNTLPARLKEVGYTTGMFGKWHLGTEAPYHPNQRGFDEFFGFLGGGHDYLDAGGGKGGPNAIQHNGEPVASITYATDEFAGHAAEFINKSAKAEKPFFVYLPFNAVHTPMQTLDKYLNRFPNISDRKRRIHAAMLSAMDDGVGRVLDALSSNNVTSNTLVFFISDNGGPTPSNTSSNAPLRGFKRDLLEGGIRIPFLVKWPGLIPAGKIYEKPVISLDIHATALAAAGTTAPANLLDGVDLLPHLKSSNETAAHENLFWRFGPQWAVRSGDWKLINTGHPGVPPQLYNLAEDIGEKNDLATNSSAKAHELKSKFDNWNSQLVEPLWAKSTNLTGASTGEDDDEMSEDDGATTKGKSKKAGKKGTKHDKKELRKVKEGKASPRP